MISCSETSPSGKPAREIDQSGFVGDAENGALYTGHDDLCNGDGEGKFYQ